MDALNRKATRVGSSNGFVERFEDVIRHPLYAQSVTNKARIGGWSFGFSRMRLQPGYVDNLKVGYSALAVYRAPTRIQLTVMGEEREARDYLQGEVIVRPRGLDYKSRYFRPTEVNVLALETDAYRQLIGKKNADVEDTFSKLQVAPFLSPIISLLMARLDRCVFETDQSDPLYLDAVLQTVCLELWQSVHGTIFDNATPEGKLGRGHLRKINEYIDEVCPGKVDLMTLSDLLDVSPTKLRSLFKSSFDQSLYQYVLRRRLDKARQLVETTKMSLAEVCYQSGFSSQSHMTDQFRSKLGITPGKLRRLQR